MASRHKVHGNGEACRWQQRGSIRIWEDRQMIDECANGELYFGERNGHRVKKGGVDMNSTYILLLIIRGFNGGTTLILTRRGKKKDKS
jgi:hypothetical protein